jgi:hypothetical protein
MKRLSTSLAIGKCKLKHDGSPLPTINGENKRK